MTRESYSPVGTDSHIIITPEISFSRLTRLTLLKEKKKKSTSHTVNAIISREKKSNRSMCRAPKAKISLQNRPAILTQNYRKQINNTLCIFHFVLQLSII